MIKLNEVVIFNRCLSQKEIDLIYEYETTENKALKEAYDKLMSETVKGKEK
jgi:hypothetical protein